VLQGSVLAAQLTYWQQLEGIPLLNLPTAIDRGSDLPGRNTILELSPTLTSALKALSQQSGDFVHDLASNVPDVAVSLPGKTSQWAHRLPTATVASWKD